ncbi:MAG: CDP-glycerol glycerophosphotransferase family protein [Parcubacteria group bacterium]|nr:CDP-glycerol glycerophosphotransferase family protein [Parcubacteria group bacterium]
MQKKIIFITLPFGISARNVICARIVKKLIEKDFRVVIIAPQKSHELLRKFYPSQDIILEPYPKYEGFFKGGVFKEAGIFERILMGLINSSINTSAVKCRRRELLLKKKYFNFITRWIFQTIFGGYYRSAEIFRKLDAKYFPDKWFGELFKKYQPTAVFSPHVQFDFNLIKRAKAEGVPSFGQILSIDNLTSKGNIRAKSDYLFVWNDTMKKEAIKYNTFSPSQVKLVGIPQFDIYFDKSILMTREEFCSQIGADINKQILVHASEARESPNDREFLDFILEAQKNNCFVKSFSIIAREHPRDTSNPFKKFEGVSNVFVSRQQSAEGVFIDKWYPSYENIKFSVNLMYHASIVLMTGGTIGLDAAGFDKPVISLGFDFLPKHYLESIERYHDHFPHIHTLFYNGGLRVAKNKENLIKEINRYLKNPEYDREKRKELTNDLFYKFDGHAGDRIVENIISNI